MVVVPFGLDVYPRYRKVKQAPLCVQELGVNVGVAVCVGDANGVLVAVAVTVRVEVRVAVALRVGELVAGPGGVWVGVAVRFFEVAVGVVSGLLVGVRVCVLVRV